LEKEINEELSKLPLSYQFDIPKTDLTIFMQAKDVEVLEGEVLINGVLDIPQILCTSKRICHSGFMHNRGLYFHFIDLSGRTSNTTSTTPTPRRNKPNREKDIPRAFESIT